MAGETGAKAPIRVLRAAVLSDANDLPAPGVTRLVYFGQAGTVSLIAVDDSAPVQLTVTAGLHLPLRVRRIMATGTSVSAGSIILGY
jgi:hypothetical protein